MVSLTRNRSCLHLAAIASLTLIFVGCVNLDKRDPSPFRPGQKTTADQTVATKSGVRMPPKKLEKMVNPSSFAKKMKQAWPFGNKAKLTVQDMPIADNDPTRLDNMPKNVGPELHVATAKMAEKAGDMKAAMTQYQAALTKDGSNRKALIGLARLQHRVGNTQGAIQVYRDAMNIYRDDPVIMNDLGICYARSNQTNESIAMLEAATRAAPEREMYLNNLSAALVDANRTDEALTRLSQRRGPAVANYNVGYLLTKSGRKSEAQPYLQRALQLEPDMQPARSLLAQKPVYQVSARPENSPRPSTPAFNSGPAGPTAQQSGSTGYEIPVSRENTLTAPADFSNADVSDSADLPEAIAPPANAPTWQSNTGVGPFGFTPANADQAIRVVSYVEEVAE